MARAAFVLRPKVVIVENVPAVVHDRNESVRVTAETLRLIGYDVVDDLVIRLDALGVPQTRKRHFLIASRVQRAHLVALTNSIAGRCPHPLPRTVRWAIEDLVDRTAEAGSGTFDAPSQPSAENQHRMGWLFRNGAHWLDDPERPRCHRDGNHSYRSIYGRMHWDRPAQTVTTGFGSMGQGCYVHPSQQRTITPHEAARLQTFPDFFRFDITTRRTAWARLIGNAVPPFAMREIAREVLDQLFLPARWIRAKAAEQQHAADGAARRR
jgi:DNA (cytosine-5)-methyltransferase 1